MMDTTFMKHIEALPRALASLLEQAPVTTSSLPDQMPMRGVYVLSEGTDHLYVGRTNRLKIRLRNHGRPGSTQNQATFAFRLARESTGNLKATYKKEGSREQLMKDPAFAAVFTKEKTRIALMDARFIEETDPVRQCLLEIYVALALDTRYNDFDNH